MKFLMLTLQKKKAVFSPEGENFPYVRPKVYTQKNERALIDTTSCTNGFPDTFLSDRIKHNPELLVIDELSISSVEEAAGQ